MEIKSYSDLLRMSIRELEILRDNVIHYMKSIVNEDIKDWEKYISNILSILKSKKNNTSSI